jgi:hypothetical protein
MELILLAALLIAALLLGWAGWSKRRSVGRLEAFSFPPYLRAKLHATYPHLTERQSERVLRGLKQYFAMVILARGKRVAMPSQSVDVAWHEFILSTRAYADFCNKVIGRFVHHTPAEAMAGPTQAQADIRRAWALACRLEKISTTQPSRLPLIFALDASLKIPNGFTYRRDCTRVGAGDGYCASHIGCSGGDSSGGGDGQGGHGDGGHGGCGGDGGGCGGD